MKNLFFLFLFIAFFSSPVKAQYTHLYDLNASSDGSYPLGDLISDGTFLYGTTNASGANGFGEIFRIKPDGSNFSVIYSFDSINGDQPKASLVYDGTYLYGTTEYGGTNDMGIVFKILPNGTGFQNIHNFSGVTDGAGPMGTLYYDGVFLYGMTVSGGAVNNSGVLFKLLPDGTGFQNLLDFNITNGAYPHGGLFSDGVFLYGMTGGGGAFNQGVIFKILPTGTGYTDIFDFNDGNAPFGTLISDGTYLYGVTAYGGTFSAGIVFKIKPDGTNYLKLINLIGQPNGSLVSDGTFVYGLTVYGGTNNMGTLFKVNMNGGGYANLKSFGGIYDGIYPYGSLYYDGNFLYGMTSTGGNNYGGVIFRTKTCLNSAGSQFVNLCAGDSVIVGTHSYFTSGTYHDTIPNATGCDSVITTFVNVNSPINTTVSVNGADFSTVQLSGLFQWIDCNTDSAIAGETNHNFTATVNGNYAVAITQNGCTDTSQCISINDVGMSTNSIENEVRVYPNPSNGKFIVELPQGTQSVLLEVYNTLGEKIISQTTNYFDLSGYASGIYFLKITDGKTISTKKITLR